MEGADGVGMPWSTITDDFDADFGVGEWHGNQRIPARRRPRLPHLSIDSRGDEATGSTWSYLDITALGRQEEWEDSPEGFRRRRNSSRWRLHHENDLVAR